MAIEWQDQPRALTKTQVASFALPVSKYALPVHWSTKKRNIIPYQIGKVMSYPAARLALLI